MENEDFNRDKTYAQSTAGTSAAGTTAAPATDAPNQYTAIFVLGLCSILGLFVVPVVGWIVSLVCGIVALVMASRARQTAKLQGLGYAGFILAIIGTVLSGLLTVLVLIVLIAGLAFAGSVASGTLGAGLGPFSDMAWFFF